MHTQHPLSPVYSLLVQNDPKDENKLISDLAQRWETSADGKVWTFYLQKGAKFHDGRPATSADVKVSFDRIASPPKGIRSPRAGLFSALERIETPDDQTVKFFLKYPQGGFLTMVASPYNWIYPKHVLAEKGDMTKVAVGTGPFKLKEYIRGVSWELVKNADYFVPGRPYLDGILRYIMVDRASMFAAIRTHRIQLSTMLNNETTPAERDILKKETPQIVQKGGTLANPMWLFFNHKRAPWSDARVRQAVNLAYDRQAAIKVARKGDGTLGAHFLPGSGWDIPEKELLTLPGYRQPKDQDIAEAKKLLAEAGFPQGFKTTMLYWNEALYSDQAVFLKDQLVKIGIDATLNPKESGAFYADAFAHNFDLMNHAVGYSVADPDVFISELYLKSSASNYGEYYNAQVEELFVKQSQAIDQGERRKLVRQIQDIFLKDHPNIIYFWQANWAFWWPEVKDWAPASSIYLNQKFQDVWLAQ